MPDRLAAAPPATAAPCSEDWLLRLTESGNAALCGGKAAGLAHLRRAGLPVPDGICLTTDLCRAALREIGVAARVREIVAVPSMAPQERSDRLAEIRRLIEGPSLSAHV